MKKYLLLIVLIFSFVPTQAVVSFKFKPGTTSGISASLKATMESNASALLTEINNAGNAGRDLNLSGIKIQPEAANRLRQLWSNWHFVPENDTEIQRLICDMQGYQIRDIPITVKPIDDLFKQSLQQELNISFDKSGCINGVRPALETQHSARSIMSGGVGVTDAAQRYEILKFVEDFRCFYEEKNTQAIYDIFSPDALIITGSVITRKERSKDGGWRLRKDIKYNEQNRDQYVTKLKTIFRNTRKMEVGFDNITIVRSGSHPEIYGVTLHQTWKTDTYKDDGWLFLVWDFANPTEPKIHVRTWQPDEIVGGKSDVFTLSHFFLSRNGQ